MAQTLNPTKKTPRKIPPDNATACRLGAIGFVNTLPIYHHPSPLSESTQLTYGSPAQLNQWISHGELDISPVSAAHFLTHQDSLTLLPGLSVSSYGGVESVLFLQRPEPTPDDVILVPDDSATSVAVLKAMLGIWPNSRGLGVGQPLMISVPADELVERLADGYSGLLIGDRALQLYAQYKGESPNNQLPQYLHHYTWIDLATEWHCAFGIPLVFAVWVARTSWLAEHSSTAQVIMDTLIAGRNAFFDESNHAIETRVLAHARNAYPNLSESTLTRYWHQALDYGWTPGHEASLHTLAHALYADDISLQQAADD